MVRATQRELAELDVGDPDVVLADAGYWHQRQMQRIASEGIEVLVAPDAGLRRGARPGWTGGMYSFMRRVLATPHGHDLYRQRQITVEPVFGQIKFNRAMKRFQRRGRTACRSEWKFIAATHNLLKAPPPPPRRRDTMTAAAAPAAAAHGAAKLSVHTGPSEHPPIYPTASGERSSGAHRLGRMTAECRVAWKAAAERWRGSSIRRRRVSVSAYRPRGGRQETSAAG
jgi:hypothetical protein